MQKPGKKLQKRLYSEKRLLLKEAKFILIVNGFPAIIVVAILTIRIKRKPLKNVPCVEAPDFQIPGRLMMSRENRQPDAMISVFVLAVDLNNPISLDGDAMRKFAPDAAKTWLENEPFTIETPKVINKYLI